MKLTQLHITKLPGIATPIHVDSLSGDINFITGPNASGKSSLIRALHYLLTPPAKEDPIDLILSAELTQGNQTWSVTRIGAEQSWRCDGQPASRPNLPAGETLSCHLIRIEDLVSLNHGSDEQLAENIRIELDGGLNLRQLKTQLLEAAKATARTEKRQWRDANEQLNQVRSEHRALHSQRQALPDLEAKIQSAKSSAATCQSIRLALEGIDQQEKIREEQLSLAALPAGVAHLTGQELEQVADLEDKHQNFKSRLAETEQRIAQHTQTLGATGFAEGGPSQSDLEAMEALAEEFTQKSREIDRIDSHLTDAKARLNDALERLNLDEAEVASALPDLTVETINEAIELGRRLDQAHANTLQAQGASARHPALWAYPAIAALTGLGVGVGLWLGSPTVSVGLGMAGAAGLAWLSWSWSRQNTLASDAKSQSQTLEQIQADVSAFTQKTGLSIRLFGEASAAIFTDAYRQYRQAETEHAELKRSLAKEKHQTEKLEQQLRDFLSAWTPMDIPKTQVSPQPAVYRAKLSQLRNQHQTAEHARQALDRARQESALLKEDLENTRQAIDSIYGSVDLHIGARHDLERLMSLRPTWQAHQTELARAQAILDDRLSHLADSPKLIEAVQSNDRRSLDEQLEYHESQAQTLESLQDKKSRILEAIDRTSKGHALAEASAALDEASHALKDKRESVLMAEAGVFWLSHIETHHRSKVGETTMDRAQRLFSQFTHHQWTLGAEEHFYGIQSTDKKQYPLSQLSTATRMQLLLAVRIANVIQNEQGRCALPLVIDEALATSDAQRALSIIDNLNTLAFEHERQIIYLAASDYECRLWESVSRTEPHTIELAPSPSLPKRQPDFEIAHHTPIPAPGDLAPAEYAQRIGVPSLDRNRRIEEVHLFYLLGDQPSLLHRMMEVWRIKQLGTYEHWLSNAQADQQLDVKQRARLQRRVRVMHRWWEAWLQGHGKVMDAAVLHAALDDGVLTPATLPGVIEAAQEVAFNAKALLQHLETQPITMGNKRRKIAVKKRQALLNFLHTTGHWTDEAPLTLSECRQQALRAFSPAPDDAELRELNALIDRLEAGCVST